MREVWCLNRRLPDTDLGRTFDQRGVGTELQWLHEVLARADTVQCALQGGVLGGRPCGVQG